MAPAASVGAQGDRIPVKPMLLPKAMQQPQIPMMSTASESFAKDAIIAWFRGEFAAANAIIDALCRHLTQLEGGETATYESAFEAIHRRRLNWIPILQMQKFYSISDVTLELQKAAEKRRAENVEDMLQNHEGMVADIEEQNEMNLEIPTESNENGEGKVIEEDLASEVTDSGSQEVQPHSGNINICSDHEECEARRAQFKMTKGFVAKEPVKGHIVNVVRGLKMYEGIFTDVELTKLNDLVNELRIAGKNGELSGETFILYNQQKKGNKRELIQLGVPIFRQIKADETGHIEPIPALLQGVIEHLVQWRLIPQDRKPNSCIINFFDEGEYSQPFLKPPHLDQPLSTLLLSESTMAFGHTLMTDGEGSFRGPLMLSLNEGSVLVMRGNSAETARHVMCSSANKRVSITFSKVRAAVESSEAAETEPWSSKAISWQSVFTSPSTMANKLTAMSRMIPKWGVFGGPMVMVGRPAIRRTERGGTGVFLPWNMGSRKHAKHLPPRAQRRRVSTPGSPEKGVL